MRISIYGEPKTGKTRLLASFPKPVLIIGTEDGTDSISNLDGVDFVPINSTSEVDALVAHAQTSPKKYATLGLDNATTLQAMKYSEMLGQTGIPLQKSSAAFEKIDNQEYSYLTKEILNKLFLFKGNVVFTAHERDHTDKKNPTPVSDLLVPRVGSALSKGVAGWLNGICDQVCQTFKRKKVIVEVVEGLRIEHPTDSGEFCLRCGPHPIYMAGLRVPIGAYVPDVVLNPTYEKIKKIVDGQWKETDI